MEHAARIVRDQDVCPCAVDVGQLALDDATRHLGSIERGGSAEAAADIRLRQLAQLEAAHLGEETPRRPVSVEDACIGSEDGVAARRRKRAAPSGRRSRVRV
jgi:hypothetical protein